MLQEVKLRKLGKNRLAVRFRGLGVQPESPTTQEGRGEEIRKQTPGLRPALDQRAPNGHSECWFCGRSSPSLR
jgi:hypothetical protein